MSSAISGIGIMRNEMLGMLFVFCWGSQSALKGFCFLIFIPVIIELNKHLSLSINQVHFNFLYTFSLKFLLLGLALKTSSNLRIWDNSNKK